MTETTLKLEIRIEGRKDRKRKKKEMNTAMCGEALLADLALHAGLNQCCRVLNHLQAASDGRTGGWMVAYLMLFFLVMFAHMK